MNITVYPLVWSITDKSQSFLGLTSEGQRKNFMLPKRESRYDRHQWGMFHWFEGNLNSDEFIISRIIERDSPKFKTAKVWRLPQGDVFHAEIQEEYKTTHFEADSINKLDLMLLAYIEAQEIDRLHTNQPFVMINKCLINYMIRYSKEIYTNDQIHTYCNALSCAPRELNNVKSIYPTLWKLGLPIPTNESISENTNANSERKHASPGEYRNVLSYNISNFYIEEMLKSTDEKICSMARIMENLNSIHRYFFTFWSVRLPEDVIKNIKERIQQYDPISIRGFEVEVTKPIEDPLAQKIESYDYIIQVGKFRRLIYHNSQFKSRCYATAFPYLRNLLEAITKNWYLGNKTLPLIPEKFTPEVVVVSKTVSPKYYLTVNLRKTCEENNIPTDKKIPCIQIQYEGKRIRDWPLIIYDPSKHEIDHNVYQKSIKRIYEDLENI